MGSIRVLLAVSVVFVHTYGYVFVGGKLAVQLFYATSGFLISFILTESKTYKTTCAFYYNRCLRIFPVYWTVSLISLAYIFSTYIFLDQKHQFIETFLALDWVGRTSLAASNIFLFGQDWIMFTGVRDGTFQFVSNFRISDVPVWQGLVVPQAWTLGVELSFYLIAPFVLRKPRLIIILLLFSVLVRVYLFYIGLGLDDPWTYRFFPTELALFLFGALSHQWWKPYLLSRGIVTKKTSTLFVVFICIYSSIFFLLPYRSLNYIILMSLFIFSLPFLFHFQKDRKWDRLIGDLSYPIYISHFLIIWVFGSILDRFLSVDYKSIQGSIIIVIITIIFSVFLNLSIGKFIERARISVKEQQ